MTTFEMGERMRQLGETKDALTAYTLALDEDLTPEQSLSAAAFLVGNGGDPRKAYKAFVSLYNEGHFQKDILSIMTAVYYEPSIRAIRNRYERNCRLLEKYPYCFRRDFPKFEDLPICFIPFDEHHSYTPFYYETGSFGAIFNVREQVLRHYFFKDLDKPILAEDIYSQYELNYLMDNVRPSEWIGRENHIYLHYTDWDIFCAWLQVLNLRPLIESEKFVFLFGDEIAQYPINFQERYGIDYSQFPVRPIGIREVNKLIWHTQLSTHNGGDFFNEIFDAHPNLICLPSIMMENAEEMVDSMKKTLDAARTLEQYCSIFSEKNRHLGEELFSMRHYTDKDYFVATFLTQEEWMIFVDPSSRIAPALFFQPHFHNIVYELHGDRQGRTVLTADNVRMLHKSRIFKSFKYIKTFTPMRRFTTSHGATVKFMYDSAKKGADKILKEKGKNVTLIVPDAVTQRVLNRSFLSDADDRLYKDSIVVRFEDGKLNPKATFTSLSAFLDLPYTESMTYCSEKGVRDQATAEGNVAGFDPSAIYRTYDDYVNDSERKYIEYFLRDAYAFYGYDFHYYDGGEVTAETIRKWVSDFDTIDHYIRETWIKLYSGMTITSNQKGVKVTPQIRSAIEGAMMERQLKSFHDNRLKNAQIMMGGLQFVNLHGKPLRMTPMLELDPALLEAPVYH